LPGDNAGVFYLDLFDALARHDVRYVVVGGLALNLHGVDDLIALKRAAGRAVDLADIDALERLKRLGLDG
jgi:predicted nucleotidyltransferase